MAIYTGSKPGIGGMFPAGTVDTTWTRVEPLLTAEQMVTRHLFGIPLVSGIKDPFTGKAQVMTRDLINDYIDRAVANVELETGLVLFPTQIKEKLPFDRQEYQSFGYFRTLKRPVASVDSLVISPSNNTPVFVIPQDWIEVGQLYHGQINIVPLTMALSANASQSSIVTSAGGPALLAILNNSQWIASYWEITYTVGFPNGNVPKVVNDLVGVVAAMDVLSMLAPTNARNQGSSLSIDGMSQSVSSPGPEIYSKRVEDLEKKRAMLVNKLKAAYGLKLFSGNV